MYSSCEEVNNAISSSLKKRIEPGVFYRTEDIKQILSEEFSILKVKKSIKANMISDFVPMNYKAKKINGKVVKGYLRC